MKSLAESLADVMGNLPDAIDEHLAELEAQRRRSELEVRLATAQAENAELRSLLDIEREHAKARKEPF